MYAFRSRFSLYPTPTPAPISGFPRAIYTFRSRPYIRIHRPAAVGCRCVKWRCVWTRLKTAHTQRTQTSIEWLQQKKSRRRRKANHFWPNIVHVFSHNRRRQHTHTPHTMVSSGKRSERETFSKKLNKNLLHARPARKIKFLTQYYISWSLYRRRPSPLLPSSPSVHWPLLFLSFPIDVLTTLLLLPLLLLLLLTVDDHKKCCEKLQEENPAQRSSAGARNTLAHTKKIKQNFHFRQFCVAVCPLRAHTAQKHH